MNHTLISISGAWLGTMYFHFLIYHTTTHLQAFSMDSLIKRNSSVKFYFQFSIFMIIMIMLIIIPHDHWSPFMITIISFRMITIKVSV